MICIVTTAVCFLPACFPHLYILVEEAKTWTEAQRYCKEKYTDLASVRNKQDLAQLNNLIGSNSYVWIGLHTDPEAWRWSLENQDYYGEGEAGFRKWANGEPNGQAYNKVCAVMFKNGYWVDGHCTTTLPFICYNGKNS